MHRFVTVLYASQNLQAMNGTPLLDIGNAVRIFASAMM
jgi:hypothetical protein